MLSKILNRRIYFFLMILPIFNALMLSSVNYIKDAIPISAIRGLIHILIIIYFFKNSNPKHSVLKIIYLFSLDIFLMGLITYIRYNTFDLNVIKIIIANLFFAFGYQFVKDDYSLKIFSRGMVYTLSTIILFIIISSILGLKARQVYANIGVNFGGMGVNITKTIVLFLLMIPLFLKVLNNNNILRKVIVILIFMSLIVIVLGMKRGAFLGLISGFSVYFFITKRKIRFIRYLSVFGIILVLASPFYMDKLVAVYEVRSANFSIDEEENLDNEARFHEIIKVTSDFIVKNPINMIFGEGIASEFYYYNTKRMFHIDFTSLLHGTGLLGIFLYYYFYVLYFKRIKRLYVYNKNNQLVQEIFAVSVSLMIATLFMMLSGFYHGIDNRAFFLLFLGGMMGYLERLNKNQIQISTK